MSQRGFQLCTYGPEVGQFILDVLNAIFVLIENVNDLAHHTFARS